MTVCRTKIRGHRRTCCAKATTDGGFVLLFTIAVMLLLSIGGLALLSLTATESNVATGLPKATAFLREADGALDKAVNQIRDSGTNVTDSSGNLTDSTYHCDNFDFSDVVGNPAYPHVQSVTCSNSLAICGSPVSSTCNQRDLTISVMSSTSTASKPFGRVRVVLTDTVGTGIDVSVVPGYLIDVCDWQVGAALSSTVNSCGR